MKIKIKCPKCGYEPLPNKEKSTDNWNVFDTKCTKCGTDTKIVLDDKG